MTIKGLNYCYNIEGNSREERNGMGEIPEPKELIMKNKKLKKKLSYQQIRKSKTKCKMKNQYIAIKQQTNIYFKGILGNLIFFIEILIFWFFFYLFR